jgi:hypothetical protein
VSVCRALLNLYADASIGSSLVSFGVKSRAMGEAAKTLETSNFKNTVGSLKRLIGRSLNDPEISEQEKQYLNAQLVDVDGTVGVKVNTCVLSTAARILTMPTRSTTSASLLRSLLPSSSRCTSASCAISPPSKPS